MHYVTVPAALVGLLKQIGRNAHQQGASAYAVGGCVRDWLLDITKAPDLDVAVEGDGVMLARAIADDVHGMLTVHPQFGTATVTWGRPSTEAGYPQCFALRSKASGVGRRKCREPRGSRLRRLDVATCRKEIYAKPAAYPKVTPGTLDEDLGRRDFTINAMAMALDPARFGTRIDPFGGAGDLRQRRLRMLHARSFSDDPSRILRGVRFAQRFGFRWESETERAVHEAIRSGGLGRLNAGRIHKELERMCDEPNPAACFNQLAELLVTSEAKR